MKEAGSPQHKASEYRAAMFAYSLTKERGRIDGAKVEGNYMLVHRDGHVASMREDGKGNVSVDMYCRHLRRKYQRMNPEFACSLGKAMAYVVFSATVIGKSEDDIWWLGYAAARLGEMGIEPEKVKQVFDAQRDVSMAAKQMIDFYRKNTN